MEPFCQTCRRPIPGADSRYCPYCGQSTRPSTAEQRYAIVVFADVSGFTALSTRLSPAALRKLLDELMQKLCQIVLENRGTLDKVIGDSVMFVFGAEQATTEDALRTLETIERMRHEMERFNHEHELDLGLHAGVACGLVSVGRVGPSQTVMGEVVNLASRLLHWGGKEDVIVSPAFFELLDESFHLEPLSPTELKGFHEPVAPYRYLGRKPRKPPMEDFFVGRERELQTLEKSVDGFLSGTGHKSFLVYGPAGIGKSTLLQVFSKRLERRNLCAFKISFGDSSSRFLEIYRLLIAFLLGREELQADPRRDAWTQLLQSFSTQHVLEAEFLPFAVSQMIQQMTQKTPFLLFVEDLHAAETSSKHILDEIRKHTSTDRVFFLASSRTLEEEFGNRIQLETLSDQEAEQVFHRWVGRDLPVEIPLREILTSCKGNPFMIRSVAQAIQRGVPPSRLFSGNVELLLSATLDTFPQNAQELLKTASLFGTQVPLPYLSKMTGESEENLAKLVAPLAIFHPGEKAKTIVFDHILVQQAAYGRIDTTLLPDLHGKAGEVLENAKAPPEHAAYHYVRSNRKEKALLFSLEAAKRLSRLPRYTEAEPYLKKAQELSIELRDPARLAESLSLRFQLEARKLPLHQAMELWKGLAATGPQEFKPAVLAHLLFAKAEFYFDRRLYDQALEPLNQLNSLGSGIDTDLTHAKILWRLGKLDESRRIALEKLAAGSLLPHQKGELLIVLGNIAYRKREIPEAEKYFNLAYAEFERVQDLMGLKRVLGNLGNIAYVQTHYEVAKDFFTQAAELSLKMGDIIGYCEWLLHIIHVQIDLLEYESALKNSSLALDFLKGAYSQSLLNRHRRVAAILYLYMGDYEKADVLLQLAFMYFSKNPSGNYLGQTLSALARLRLEQGSLTEALDCIDRVLQLRQPETTDYQLARLLRIELLHRLGRTDEAQQQCLGFQKDADFDKVGEDTKSYFLLLDSMTSERKDRGKFQAIKSYLENPGSRCSPMTRLELLNEALKYRPDEKLLRDRDSLAKTIREKFPPEYRGHFDKVLQRS